MAMLDKISMKTHTREGGRVNKFPLHALTTAQYFVRIL